MVSQSKQRTLFFFFENNVTFMSFAVTYISQIATISSKLVYRVIAYKKIFFLFFPPYFI